jgi:hypothetical protein
MSKHVVIAVDATERSLDAVALGKRLADATGDTAVLVSVFPCHPLEDPTGEELTRVHEEAHGILLELGRAAAVEVADVEVIASNLVARELHRVSERLLAGPPRRLR